MTVLKSWRAPGDTGPRSTPPSRIALATSTSTAYGVALRIVSRSTYEGPSTAADAPNTTASASSAPAASRAISRPSRAGAACGRGRVTTGLTRASLVARRRAGRTRWCLPPIGGAATGALAAAQGGELLVEAVDDLRVRRGRNVVKLVGVAPQVVQLAFTRGVLDVRVLVCSQRGVLRNGDGRELPAPDRRSCRTRRRGAGVGRIRIVVGVARLRFDGRGCGACRCRHRGVPLATPSARAAAGVMLDEHRLAGAACG